MKKKKIKSVVFVEEDMLKLISKYDIPLMDIEVELNIFLDKINKLKNEEK